MSYTFRIGVVCVTLALVGPASAQTKGKGQRPASARSARVDVAAERQALGDADEAAAIAAAGRLGQSRQPGALDALMNALALGLRPPVAVAALDALGAHAQPKSYDVLAHYARYRNGNVRAAAVRALGSLDDSRASAAVLRALRDDDEAVRGAAAAVVAKRKLRPGVEALLALLEKGDEAAASSLATLADPDLARAIAELIGVAPNGVLARSLGEILLRSDFGPETARVEVVRAIGKIPGTDSLEQLTTYVASVPENPPRQSRREAEAIVEAKLTGGD